MIKEHWAYDTTYPQEYRRSRRLLGASIGGVALGVAAYVSGITGITGSEVIDAVLAGAGEIGGAVSLSVGVYSADSLKTLEERRVESVEWCKGFLERHTSRPG
jgi:hypothetical protein